jgi:hypothetical protein
LSLRRVTPLLLVAGVALMIPFESTLARLFGVVCLLAFIACGTLLIASPEFLSGEEDEPG